MSFELICPKCGAHSGPSVGICPYCKTALQSGGAAGNAPTPGLSAVQKYFNDGALDQALAFTKIALTQFPELAKNRDFLLLQARIYIESEANAFQVQNILNQILLLNPADTDAQDYLKIVDAKSGFDQKQNPAQLQQSEQTLRALVGRRHDLDLAYFVLGAHLFWANHDTNDSVRFLEAAVQVRPNFLRAWGCLGAIYHQLRNQPLAMRAFQNCLRLETEPSMRKYFEDLMNNRDAAI